MVLRTRRSLPRALRQGWLQGIRHRRHVRPRSNARSPCTCHPAQPARVCCQALQILPGANQDGLAAEPANRGGVQLGATGREADPAGRAQGGGQALAAAGEEERGSVSSPVAELQSLRNEEARLLWQAQEIHPRHARLGHCSLLRAANLCLAPNTAACVKRVATVPGRRPAAVEAGALSLLPVLCCAPAAASASSHPAHILAAAMLLAPALLAAACRYPLPVWCQQQRVYGWEGSCRLLRRRVAPLLQRLSTLTSLSELEGVYVRPLSGHQHFPPSITYLFLGSACSLGLMPGQPVGSGTSQWQKLQRAGALQAQRWCGLVVGLRPGLAAM